MRGVETSKGRTKPYRARLQIKGQKPIVSGYFHTKKEAFLEYIRMLFEYHGVNVKELQ